MPPLPPDFVGELKCIEVDAAGTPIGGNHLKGEATLRDDEIGVDGVDVSKYNAVGIKGTDLVGQTGNELLLNNPESGEPQGQYDACPAITIVNHFAEGAEDLVIGPNGGRRCAESPATICATDADCGNTPCVVGGLCSDLTTPCTDEANCPMDDTCLLAGVFTELTIVPCSQDFENQRPAEVTIQFEIFNEFEERFSTSTSVVCWKNIRLQDIGNTNVFDVSVLGSTVAQTFMRPADIGDGGFVAVVETLRRNVILERSPRSDERSHHRRPLPGRPGTGLRPDPLAGSRVSVEAGMRNATEFFQGKARRRAMGMLKRGALAASLCMAGLAMSASAWAQVSSTNPAGLIVFPASRSATRSTPRSRSATPRASPCTCDVTSSMRTRTARMPRRRCAGKTTTAAPPRAVARSACRAGRKRTSFSP